ncbi:MAG: hypothetical protein M5R36_19010 [Deltaproteobacteria bacterium]|nr:hypothetical protein [Deltaproteobacteria bacterium]
MCGAAPYDMGYAHGYYLAPDILRIMEVYAFPPEGKSPLIYELAKAWVMNTFEFDDAMLNEARGIYDGMIATGMDDFVPVLGRPFDRDDILTLTGISDIGGLLCSTVAAWGPATADDPAIAGGVAVAHNTDYIFRTRGRLRSRPSRRDHRVFSVRSRADALRLRSSTPASSASSPA